MVTAVAEAMGQEGTAALLGTVADPVPVASLLLPLVRLLARILSKSRYVLVHDYAHSAFRARRLWSWFSTVDTDRSGHITVHELREYYAAYT